MSLTYALDTLEASQYGISVASETENHMTSVERVFTYTEIDPEPGYRTDTQPPKEWPKSGSLTLGDLSLAYLEGAPRILVNINVSIAAKEKVGVVGRTGAGKSSLLAALFRMPEPEGSVSIASFVLLTSLGMAGTSQQRCPNNLREERPRNQRLRHLLFSNRILGSSTPSPSN